MFFFFPEDPITGTDKEALPNELNDIILYQGTNVNVRVEIYFQDETFCLNQKKISELFGKNIRTISEHLNNIYSEEELTKEATIRKFRIVQKEDNRDITRDVDLYNLDAVIAVGYRVNSREATQFRIWTTQVLKEFIIKGFVLDLAEYAPFGVFFSLKNQRRTKHDKSCSIPPRFHGRASRTEYFLTRPKIPPNTILPGQRLGYTRFL
jgi:hypothetical protein